MVIYHVILLVCHIMEIIVHSFVILIIDGMGPVSDNVCLMDHGVDLLSLVFLLVII